MELPFYEVDVAAMEKVFATNDTSYENVLLNDTCSDSNSLRNLASFTNARSKFFKEFLMEHININSIQNKFEEFSEVISKPRMQVIIVGETKIDSSYPDSQFNIPGYVLYRNDRKKEGGGILA